LSSLRAAGKPESAEFPKDPTRIVTIKIAGAEQSGLGINWEREIKKLRGVASEIYQQNFGIEFKIIKWEAWQIDKATGTMQGLLDDLKKKIAPGEADMVIGVLGPSGPADSPIGTADYFCAYILLRLGQPESALPVVIHELGHVFGAVDLDEKNTAMNPRNPAPKFDAFSARVIGLNKNRSFHTQGFPSPPGLIKEIIAEYEARASLNRAEPEIPLFLAYLYIETKDYASATKACIEVLKANSENTEIHGLLGNLYLAQGRTNEAIAEYRRVIEWNPQLPIAHFNLGVACLQKGEEDEATFEFREAVRLNPNYAEAHADLGQQLLKKGEVDTALDHVRTALEIFPEFPEGLCILGAALILKEKEALLEEAVSVLRRAVALKPGLPEAHSILGVAYGFRGKDNEAESELLKALELKPDSIEAHLNLAVLCRKTGREIEAAFHLGRVAAIDRDFAARHESLTTADAGLVRYTVFRQMIRQK
jgi:Flp pilus assembly protein TadD